MSWRTVVVTGQSKLDYKMGYMVVRNNEDTKKVHLDEIAVVMVENPAVSITGCLIEALTEKKIRLVICDKQRNPIAELVPHHGSHDSTAKIRTQIKWSDDIKGIIWREIISEKIRQQADFLEDIGKNESADKLRSYIGQVELFDQTNREGHAAKVYFNSLFGMEFSRSASLPENAALNYGYSIILSCVNREISANGYLTQLGIFHDNMFNHFNLGCDIMEPFRILVDRYVYGMKPTKFEKEEKHELYSVLTDTVVIDNSSQLVLNAIKIYTRSVFDAINDADASKIKFYTFTR